MNDFDELDELERELGPSLRSALRRAADEITEDPQARETIVSYLDTSEDERITSGGTPGGGWRRIVVIVAAIAAAAAIVIAAIALVSRDDESAPVDQPSGVTAGETTPTSGVTPATSVRPPYFLNLATGERARLPDEIADPDVVYIPSPDGTQLALSTCCTRTDHVIQIANTDGSGVHELPHAPGRAAVGPRWSPDGTKVVYQERDGSTRQFGTIVVLDLATGARTQLVDFGDASEPNWYLSPTFSTDGERVLYQLVRTDNAATSDVWSVPVTGGEPTMVVENASYPVAVGDGEIAFVSPTTTDLSGDTISITRDDGTGTPRTVVEARRQGSVILPTVSPDGTRLAYQDALQIWVVDLATGESAEVAESGSTVQWLDDDTLIVMYPQ